MGREFERDESGQATAEYLALTLAVVILLALGGSVLKGALHTSMNAISDWAGSIDPPGAPQWQGRGASGQGGQNPGQAGNGGGAGQASQGK